MLCIVLFVLQIVITLEIYGVKRIVGIPFGYRGFSDEGLNEISVGILLKCFTVLGGG